MATAISKVVICTVHRHAQVEVLGYRRHGILPRVLP